MLILSHLSPSRSAKSSGPRSERPYLCFSFQIVELGDFSKQELFLVRRFNKEFFNPGFSRFTDPQKTFRLLARGSEIEMCYSAMVVQNAKKLELKFHARVQYEMYDSLFSRRLVGEKLSINKALEYQFTHDPVSEIEKSIGHKILRWHESQIPDLEKNLFTQKKRLADAVRALETKPTKKAENEKRVATNKIDKILEDLQRNRTSEIVVEWEERIFPHQYMSMICLDETGQRVVRPVRYLMRPKGQDSSFDQKYNGCYNARIDSLDKVPWWKQVFGRNHGLIVVQKFYENVEASEYSKKFKLPEGDQKNLVLCFEPEDHELMLIPTLWDRWEKDGEVLYSAALLTDEPAPEVAETGHNRTPIFLNEAGVEGWLSSVQKTKDEYFQILQKRKTPRYAHHIVAA